MSERDRTLPSKTTPIGPKVIRITPEGRREVDPMSIIGSHNAKKHLQEISEIAPTKPDSDR